MDAVAVTGEAWRQYAVCGQPQPREHLIGYEFLVYGKVQRTPEMHIVERRLVDIEPDVRNAEARWRNLQLAGEWLIRVFETLEVEDADARDVYLVVLVQRHRLAAREVEHHLVNIRRLAVEVVVALQDDMLANLVLFQHERSR